MAIVASRFVARPGWTRASSRKVASGFRRKTMQARSREHHAGCDVRRDALGAFGDTRAAPVQSSNSRIQPAAISVCRTTATARRAHYISVERHGGAQPKVKRRCIKSLGSWLSERQALRSCTAGMFRSSSASASCRSIWSPRLSSGSRRPSASRARWNRFRIMWRPRCRRQRASSLRHVSESQKPKAVSGSALRRQDGFDLVAT